jgi:hypothetical protein
MDSLSDLSERMLFAPPRPWVEFLGLVGTVLPLEQRATSQHLIAVQAAFSFSI